MIKNRVTKLEKLSSHNKTHRIGQQDCLVLNDFELCTPESCRYGCWLSESEYKAYMKQHDHLITEWDDTPEQSDEGITVLRQKEANDKVKAESKAILSELLNGGC